MSYGYERRNQRIRNEAVKVAQSNLAVEAEKEKYRLHHIAEAEKADKPYKGMNKE